LGRGLGPYRINRKLPLEIGEVLFQPLDSLPEVSPVVLKERPKLGLELEILPSCIAFHERLDLRDAGPFQDSGVCYFSLQLA